MNSYYNETFERLCGERGILPASKTAKLFSGDEAYELWTTEADIDFEGETVRGVMVQKVVYDRDEPGEVDHAETIYVDAWALEV